MHPSGFLILAAGLAFALSWSVGANDLANVMSTALTSKAISARQAIVVAIIFEFLGAFLGGTEVINTIRSGIIDMDALSGQSIIIGMLSTLAAATTWMTLSSRWGMPVSITNTMIGGLIGFSSTIFGVHAIDWQQVRWIALSWLASPTIACFFAYTLFMSIQSLIFWTSEPAYYARRYIRLYLLLVSMILSMMVVIKFLKHMNWIWSHSINLGVSLGCSAVFFSLGWWAIRRVHYEDELPTRRAQFDYVERLFRVCTFLTACAMVFAHGSNDVAIIMAPVAVVKGVVYGDLSQTDPIPYWTIALGCSGVVLGLMMYGRKVIETVGRGITAMTPSRAFAATLAAATTVVVSTGTGIPVSATQTLVGAVLGVGLARGIGALNLTTIRNIVLSWVVTLPTASILAIGYHLLFQRIFIKA